MHGWGWSAWQTGLTDKFFRGEDMGAGQRGPPASDDLKPIHQGPGDQGEPLRDDKLCVCIFSNKGRMKPERFSLSFLATREKRETQSSPRCRRRPGVPRLLRAEGAQGPGVSGAFVLSEARLQGGEVWGAPRPP